MWFISFYECETITGMQTYNLLYTRTLSTHIYVIRFCNVHCWSPLLYSSLIFGADIALLSENKNSLEEMLWNENQEE